MRYRADIDGLRAIAVLAVVFFHLDLPGFSGGYIGVDVFFVISGFLVTSIIRRAVVSGNFTFRAFYTKRVRRLLPALAFVLTLTTLTAICLFLPSDLEEYARSLAATQLFSANIFFWRTSSYFATASELKPLLHTWSLAVEEQFYIIFPIFLVLLLKFGKRWMFPIVLIGLIFSFISSQFILHESPSASFYLPMFRAWELLLGAAVAIWNSSEKPPIFSRLAASAFGILGLLLILLPVLLYSQATPFPGIAALIPTFGTAFVIQAGHGYTPLVTRFLALKFFVFVGLISYSLYLWHWPIIVFYKYVVDDQVMSWTHVLLMLALMFVLSALSWKFVERPFRNNTTALKHRTALLSLLATSVVFLLSAFFLVSSHGFPNRFDTTTVRLDSMRTAHVPFRECFEISQDRLRAGDFCNVGQQNVPPDRLIWGDSHSLALLPTLDSIFRKHGQSAVYAGTGACPPLFDVENQSLGGKLWGCLEFNDAVNSYLTSTRGAGIRQALMIGVWNSYANDSSRYALLDREGVKWGNQRSFANAMNKTLSFLHERNIQTILFLQVPSAGYDVPFTAAKKRAYGTAPLPEYQENPTFFLYSAQTWITLKSLQNPIHQIDLATPLCTGTTCRTIFDGIPLYRDKGHLSVSGGMYILPHVESELMRLRLLGIHSASHTL